MSVSNKIQSLGWDLLWEPARASNPSPVFNVTKTGFHHCTLCNIKVKTGEIQKHEQGDVHQHLLKKLMLLQHKRFSYIGQLMKNALKHERNIQQIANPKWQAQLRDNLFSYHIIDFDSPSNELPDISTEVKKFMHLEKLSLLEQVAWKHATILEKFDGHGGLSGKIFLETGWKKYKKETRRHSAIQVIVRRVMPFLNRP